jgi:heme/copper-type cytochrome/quinol oxidase subunit 4
VRAVVFFELNGDKGPRWNFASFVVVVVVAVVVVVQTVHSL